MSQAVKQGYWFAITGSNKIDYIEQNGKLYISVDDAAGLVFNYRIKLVRLGLLQLKGLTALGVIDLLLHLADTFKLLNRFKNKQIILPGEKEEPSRPHVLVPS